MPKNAIQQLAPDTWAEITANDVDDITVIHRGGAEVVLQFGDTGGGDEPAATDGKGLPVKTGRDGFGDGFLKKPLTELTYVATPKRVYARANGGPATLFVEHG